MKGLDMKNRKNLLTFLAITGVLLWLTPSGLTQLREIQKQEPPEILTVRAVPPTVPVSPGETLELTLEFSIRPGYHINSAKPEDELLIPTSIEFKELPVVEVKEVVFPAAVKKKFKFSEKMLSVYEGQVKMKVRLKLAEDFCGSSLQLEGKVRYQACNDEACLRPMTAPFQVKIKVAS
ncbi:MAG: protein-disulfide reductase DsbD N-terminal domain-containing protein [Candidatus Saccharicenans sp.]